MLFFRVALALWALQCGAQHPTDEFRDCDGPQSVSVALKPW